jgi:hypothetical protein
MDLHPVAVTLARVTYLLAIGRERLMQPDRGRIEVPVYLGDSVQWKREADDLFTGGHLVIETAAAFAGLHLPVTRPGQVLGRVL